MTQPRKSKRKLAQIPLAHTDQKTLLATCPWCDVTAQHTLERVTAYLTGHPDLVFTCTSCGAVWIDVQRGEPEAL